MTRVAGLTAEQAERRLVEAGPNELPSAPPLRWPVAVRNQLIDPVMLVLLVALGLTLAIGDVADASVIGMVIVIDGALGAVQELRSARAVAALAELTAPQATVIRGGRPVDVPARFVVPGDLIVLAAGDIVPADADLVEAVTLQLDESVLTGESLPAERASGERVRAGTVVRKGRGLALVTATASATELGRIAGSLQAARPRPTPLQRQLAGLGRFLAGCVGVIAVAVAAIDIAGGHGVDYSITIALSLAVAAIPESLPAVVTLALAMAARRMVGVGVLARRLAAVEALGSVTVLASDKTGTLTRGRMTVGELWTPRDDAAARAELLTAAVLCNDAASDGAGQRDDPSEIAIIDAARERGLDVAALRAARPRIAEEPFDADLARMTTEHVGPDGGTVRYCKGSPEALSRLGAGDDAAAGAAARSMAHAGRRVLAVAEGTERGWRLLGLVGLDDPARPEAAAVIDAFRAAGVRPVMITGDHEDTARRVAATVHIAAEDVFARVTPDRKRTLVAELQDAGDVVAMTGDGVNDAPALRRADVGVAMGRRGTEVAKQAAELILVEDDLSAMVAAIGEGRRAYDNVRRFLRYAVSGGLAEVLVMLVGPMIGLPVPLQPGQILWVNLLTHGLPGVAMGNEAAEPDVLARPPRSPREPLADRTVITDIAVYGALITGACLAVALWAKADGRPWQTCLFATLTLAQLALGLLLRPRRHAGPANRSLLAAVALNTVLVAAAVWWDPLRGLLHTEALGPGDVAGVLVAVASFTVAAEVARVVLRTTRRAAGSAAGARVTAPG